MTKTSEKVTNYNGWTNYETWNVALWIDNDRGLADEVTSMARRQTKTYELGQEIKGFIEELCPDLGASMFADLLNASLREVNWYEIAEHYIDQE